MSKVWLVVIAIVAAGVVGYLKLVGHKQAHIERATLSLAPGEFGGLVLRADTELLFEDFPSGDKGDVEIALESAVLKETSVTPWNRLCRSGGFACGVPLLNRPYKTFAVAPLADWVQKATLPDFSVKVILSWSGRRQDTKVLPLRGVEIPK